jgi:hypothetical protein
MNRFVAASAAVTQRASRARTPQSGLSALPTLVDCEKKSASTLRISNRGCHRNAEMVHCEKRVLPRCAEIAHVTLGVTPHVGQELDAGRRADC